MICPYVPITQCTDKGNKISVEKTSSVPCLLQQYFQQPRNGNNPNNNQLIKNVAYKQNGILFSYKNNETMSFVTRWVEPEINILSEIIQALKKTSTACSYYMRGKQLISQKLSLEHWLSEDMECGEQGETGKG